MTGAMDTVRMLVSAQLLVTVFLAILLWSLHTRLHRPEFNRWWVWAWTSSALFLAFGRLALTFSPDWSVARGIMILLTTLVGFLVAPLLVFGAVSFRSPGAVTRPFAVGGLSAALVLGALSFAASLLWRAQPLTSFSVRHGVRGAVLAAALFFCAWVFIRRVQSTRSWAAFITSISCVGYAINQCVYAGAQAAQVFYATTGEPRGAGLLALLGSVRLLYLDVALICGVCLGMILLLVEEHQRSERALVESSSRSREVVEENITLQLEIRRRHEIEQQLRASEDRYRDLVEHSDDLWCTHDLTGRILSCNPAPARLLGYEVNELLTMSVPDVLAPDVRGEFYQYVKILERDGASAGLMKVVTKRGEHRLWAFRNTLRTDGVATPIVRGMARDVTEQWQAERSLRLSEEKFAVAFRSSPCAMAIVSLENSRFLDVNAAFESQSGYAREELLNRTSLEVGMWSDSALHAIVRAALLEQGRLEAREVPFRHRSGRVATVIFSAETVQVAGQRCVLVAGLDTTARKEAEARHQAILKALPDWVFLTDTDGVFLECHAKDQRHLLMPPSEFVGKSVVDVLPPDLASQLLACFREALQSDQPATLEYSLRVGGEHRFYEVRSVRSEQSHVLSLVRDVTDLKHAEHRARELQAELTHAGRVLALGALTGSLAHEINQPLAAIATNAHVALRMLDAAKLATAELREVIGDIVIDNQRIDDVLRRLRLLLRKEHREHALVDVNAIVNDVLKLVHSNLIERQISIDVRLGADVPRVLGDRIELQQVVLNLLMNAAEAVSAAGADDRHVIVTTTVRGHQVVVSVTDRGAAVSDTAFAKMFEPFFTTKPDGMGLGLSICRAIMDAHGGEISATRNADRGLTCWFSLEAADTLQPMPAVRGADQIMSERRAR
jgi:PAS domain S-box-containing protein